MEEHNSQPHPLPALSLIRERAEPRALSEAGLLLRLLGPEGDASHAHAEGTSQLHCAQEFEIGGCQWALGLLPHFRAGYGNGWAHSWPEGAGSGGSRSLREGSDRKRGDSILTRVGS